MEEVLLKNGVGDRKRFSLDIVDDASLILLRSYCQKIGTAGGLRGDVIERMSIIASELARNQIDHAEAGNVTMSLVFSGSTVGIELTARDRGRGLVGLQAMLQSKKEYSYESLGSGIGGVFRLADEIFIDIRKEEGSCIRARIYDRTPQIKINVGIYGHAKSNQPPCGDQGGVKEFQSGHLFSVIDGLGHGPRARKSADLLLSKFFETTEEELDPFGILHAGARSLDRSYVGATAALTYFDFLRKEIRVGRAGDVATLVVNGGKVYRTWKQVPPLAFSLSPQSFPISDRVALLGREAYIVMFTDGIGYAATDVPIEYLTGKHPFVVAENLIQDFDRDLDDVLVLVAHFEW